MSNSSRSDEIVARLRRALPEDADLLSFLSATLFEQTYAEMNTPEDMQSYLAAAFSPQRQHTVLSDPNRAVWIATDPGHTAIGYAILRCGTLDDGVAFEHPAEIERIYVDRAWHGRGAGASLMDACIAEARQRSCDGVWLGVWQENPRAIAFYRRTGFTIVGETTFTLGADVQHDYVMARALRYHTGLTTGSDPEGR